MQAIEIPNISTLNPQDLRRGSLLYLEDKLPADEKGYSIWHSKTRLKKLLSVYEPADIFPILGQLKWYSWKLFALDLRSALTIAFVLVPQAIAYSSLASVSPRRALLSAVWPLFIYGILGASRNLSVGPEAVTSVLVGVAVQREVSIFGGDANEVASILALLVGIFCVLLAVLDAGFIDNILAGYLLVGFITGAAVLIMVEQLPELLGIRITETQLNQSTFEKLMAVSSQRNTFHWQTLVLGLSCLSLLFFLKFIKRKFKKRIPLIGLVPEVLVLVIISIALSAGLSFSSIGIHILNSFPNDIIPPTAPSITLDKLGRLLPDVITITIAGYLESQAFTRQTSAKAFPSGDRELFALGSANIFGSFFGTYTTFGSLARSTIQKNSGGQTNFVGIMAASFVLILFSTCVSVLKFLPKATLSSIVFSAAVDLVEFNHIIFMFKTQSFQEILFALATFCMVFFVSIGRGILFCILLAALLILRRATKLNISLRGEIMVEKNGIMQRKFVDVCDELGAQIIDNVLILSVKGPLEFYNAGRLRRRIEMFMEVEEQIRASHGPLDLSHMSSGRLFVVASHKPPPGYTIILDLKHCDNMDNSSVFLLEEIIYVFKEMGVRFVVCNVNECFMTMFKKAGLDKLLGKDLAENIDMALVSVEQV